MVAYRTQSLLARCSFIWGILLPLVIGSDVPPGLGAPVAAETYDALVRVLLSPSSSSRSRAKEDLARKIKSDILAHESDTFSEDSVLVGRFTNPHTPDVAVGISFPPYRGNLVILREIDGRYVPMEPIVGLGFIESMQAVQLFPGRQHQLLLYVRGGGSGWRHSGEDLYRWDGKRLRLIWAWTRHDLNKGWPPGPQGEVPGRLFRGKISFRDLDGDGIDEILTIDTVEEGEASDDWRELKKVTHRSETETIHRWDDTLFYYVARHAEVIPHTISVTCRAGIPGREQLESLRQRQRVGVVEIPGGPYKDGSVVLAVVGKDLFCWVPKSALQSVQ